MRIMTHKYTCLTEKNTFNRRVMYEYYFNSCIPINLPMEDSYLTCVMHATQIQPIRRLQLFLSSAHKFYRLQLYG